jgi:thiamine-phosphate pyrophosphorylase
MIDFKIYLISDRKIFPNTDSMLFAIEKALKAGIKAVQLREKDLPTRTLLDLSYKMRELTSRYGARLFINDRVDIAMCVNADGVHLGQSSIPIYAVRRMLDNCGLPFLIGLSTHNIKEALEAVEGGADFITLGPIYKTPSKIQYGEPLGISTLKDIAREISIPVFAIGGIKSSNTKEVIDAGAFGVAVISGILGERDIESAVKNYKRAFAQ